MKIAVIGAGNVGGALAKSWASLGHEIVIGARDPKSADLANLVSHDLICATHVADAIDGADAILVATPAPVTKPIAEQLGDLSGRIVIDATNSVFAKPEPFQTGYHAFKSICNADAIKCFNTMGFETMSDPRYNDQSADMFMAGGSDKAKVLVTQLAKEIGFDQCYDFGGEDRVELIEQFALSWINLALIQKNGRGMAFKVLRR